MAKHILVVDDDVNLRELIKDALQPEGYEFFEATNGVEALRIANEKKPDLIILDLMMKRMDGYMFLEELNRLRTMAPAQYPMPRILVSTAMPQREDFGRSLKLGALAYLTKPYNTTTLLAKVKELLP